MTRNGAILVVAAGLIVTSAGTAPSRPWPPPLVESTAVLTPEVSAALECVWTTPTLRRRVHAGSARAPLEVYLAFLDTPEVTAAAARFLKLASYDVHVLDDDRYEGDDGEGARGFSQVLRRDRQRRVIFSQGEYTGPIFGTVRGSALMVLDLEPRGDSIEPNLAAYLYVEDHLAAGLTRLFAATLGFLADRKLTRGFASRRRSPNGPSTDQGTSVHDLHASHLPRTGAIGSSPLFQRAHARGRAWKSIVTRSVVEALRPRDQDAKARCDARAAPETNRLSPRVRRCPRLARMRTTGR